MGNGTTRRRISRRDCFKLGAGLGLAALFGGCDTRVVSRGKQVDDAIVYKPDGSAACPFCAEPVVLSQTKARIPVCRKCKQEFRIVSRDVVCGSCGGSGGCAFCLGTGVGEHTASCRCAAVKAGRCSACGGDGFVGMGASEFSPQ